MKQSLYKIGDKVIFFKKTDKNDAWELKKFEEYKITCVSKNLVANKDQDFIMELNIKMVLNLLGIQRMI